MVGAYQVFANQGKRIPPQGILDIWDNYGRHLYHYNSTHPPAVQVISPQIAYLITTMISDEKARAAEFFPDHELSFWDGSTPDPLYPDVAAKTGTSSGFRDAWTVGFDKEHTVAVWAGNFDGRPMRETFAVRAATPLWGAVIQELLQRDHPLDPSPENDKLVRSEICKATGLLPSRFSAAILKELFLAGTQPRKDSADYFASDGKLLLPDAYSQWCASRDNTIGAHVRSDFRITSPPANARY